MANLSLIVGLGNPGREYAQTRHNAGFWFVERLADQYGISLKNDPKFFGISGRGKIEGQDVRLLLPTTFMNLSGKSVVPFAKFYNIQPEAILIAHDELDMNPGVIRLKSGGGHGGHNGLRDIVPHIGSNFHRLRIGIGHPGSKDRQAHPLPCSRHGGQHLRRILQHRIREERGTVEGNVGEYVRR